jgi:hypothetical protein
MDDAGRVQISQGPEEGGDGRNGLARSQRTPLVEDICQAAACQVVEDQSQRAVSQSNCIVLTNQMLVVDPPGHAHQIQCLPFGIDHVQHAHDLDRDLAVIVDPNGGPHGARRI